MNRIYLPYPIEVFAKIISWFTVIVIDTIEFILAPFMRLGFKCFMVHTVASAIFTGYVYFTRGLTFTEAAIMLGLLVAGFLALVISVRVIRRLLVKVIRPPFAEIVFESVAVSFRRPRRYKKIKAN